MENMHEELKEDDFHVCRKSVKSPYLDKDDDKHIRQQPSSQF